MNLEEVDGYFAALICCPDIVLPNEYLPEICGENYSFADMTQAKRIMELLMRHWNTIASELQRTLKSNGVYFPVLLEADDGVAYGNDWAKGFFRGLDMRPAAWQELLDDEDHLGGSLFPIMVLAHEHDPDPEMRPKPIPPERREAILQAMIVGLPMIYRYFDPHRRASAQTHHDDTPSFRRGGPKVGRNDPCPCGSGKKFKQCCGAAPTLH